MCATRSCDAAGRDPPADGAARRPISASSDRGALQPGYLCRRRRVRSRRRSRTTRPSRSRSSSRPASRRVRQRRAGREGRRPYRSNPGPRRSRARLDRLAGRRRLSVAIAEHAGGAKHNAFSLSYSVTPVLRLTGEPRQSTRIGVPGERNCHPAGRPPPLADVTLPAPLAAPQSPA